MINSIFDSNSEQKIFKRLKTFWSKYVDVFPQIPVRNVVGFDNIKTFSKNIRVQNYLQKTSFDFVICELNTGRPILVIEFDGLSGGFSKESKFYIKKNPKEDIYRKLKMETKLSLCSSYQIPMIVVSYNESDILQESGDWISILDVIIGDAIEKLYYKKNYAKYREILTEAYEFGGQKSLEFTSIEIEVIQDEQNPIKRKIREITSKFPIWSSQIVFPKEHDEYIFGQFNLKWGVITFDNSFYTKKLITVDLKIRKVGIFDTDNIFLFNTIGEYCLARKTERELGSDITKWRELIKKTEWAN
ncbi:DUF2726 domain-containing protein [Myroides odoratimimus]|uniref:DUF2726 domain-containing protein n=1 Tax=Myroides odoratimimus TaxID=76832 RepID=UPI002DBE37A4|nr:DUF2726 domain-containing protein [Myroides odoratimimus]MEC4054572.1 DUF2726 domain-containing protein [Myroides odoratimimus]